MSVREHFSVTTAGALVLGGIAAIVLATIIALGGYGRSEAPSPASSRGVAPSASASASGEYLLDVSDATDPSQLSR